MPDVFKQGGGLRTFVGGEAPLSVTPRAWRFNLRALKGRKFYIS